jgi:hypothetical protein
MPNADKRLVERYELIVPSIICPSMMRNGKGYLFLVSRDISSGGAYFYTTGQPPCDGNVQMEILLKVSIADDKASYIYLTITGKIIRSNESGVAVKFNGNYKLRSFA